DQAQLAQLQGAVRADADGVELAFDPAGKPQLSVPGAQEPRSVALGGKLMLLTGTSEPAWRFASLTVTHEGSVVAADGAWGAASGRAAPLELHFTGVDRALLHDAWMLVSPGAVPPAAFSDIEQGRIVEGRLALVSAADGAVNWERSSGKLSLAELASAEHTTPRVAGGRGVLNFARGAAQLKLDAGSVDDLALSSAQLDWPRRGAPRLRVALEGDLGSPLIRDALNAQGLDRLGGTVALEAEARGERELRQPQLWRVTARLRSGRVALGTGLPAAENLTGTIRYSAQQL